MIRDLDYVGGGPHPALRLTTGQDTPEILKRAITLMLFSHDPDIRNFNGDSVVTAFPMMNNGGFSGIFFYLSLAAKRIYEILKAQYPEVASVYFSADGPDQTLRVTLNVQLNNDTESIVVYE